MASTPSLATCKRTDILASRKASCVSRTSPGLSSIKRTSSAILLSSLRHMTPFHSFQDKAKGGTLPWLRLDRDAAAMPLGDLFADGKSDTGSGKLFSLMQPLEHAKNLFEILRNDSQPIVFYRKCPLLPAVPRDGDVYLWHPGFLLIFNGIAHQVLKQLSQLRLIRQHGG